MFDDKDKMVISSVQLGTHIYHRPSAASNHYKVKNYFTAAILLIVIDP